MSGTYEALMAAIHVRKGTIGERTERSGASTGAGACGCAVAAVAGAMI